MIFNRENAEDIRKYFLNTYVKFKETGDVLWYITSVDTYRVLAENSKGDRVELHLADEAPYEMEYILPRKSYFQFQDKAVLLYRIPAQQYQRGINTKNTAMMFVGRKEDENTKYPVPVDFPSLEWFVNKQSFFSLDEAMCSDNYSCALSPRMAYIPLDGTILVDLTPVAEVNKTLHKVSMLKPIFREEVESLIKQSKLLV